MGQLPKPYLRFKEKHPELFEAYTKLGQTAAEGGPLEEKYRELIKLGMAAANDSQSAVRSHTHRALEAGATEDEVTHALLLGITTLGFPRMMAALTWAQGAIEVHGG
jgi:AhpD family alkylhydroperoxidase